MLFSLYVSDTPGIFASLSDAAAGLYAAIGYLHARSKMMGTGSSNCALFEAEDAQLLLKL